jgi:hypothetical protein
MDPKEWMERSVGIPVDPAAQREPDDAGEQPAQGGAESLTDLTTDGGGQRSEVGPPYDGTGDVQRGVEKRQHRDDLDDDADDARRR